MSKLSVRVQNMASIARQVSAAARTHAELLAEGLLSECVAAGVAPPADPGATFASAANVLDGRTEGLVAAELKYTAEQSDDGGFRAKRDAAYAKAAEATADMRGLVRDFMGAGAVTSYGLAGATPRSADKLAGFLENAIHLMERSPRAAERRGVGKLDTAFVVAELTAVREPLAEAIDEVDREHRESQEAMGARDRAMEDWRRAYQYAANVLSEGFRIARRDDLAERLRPTVRKASGDEAAPAESEAVTETPAAPAPAEPVDA